jgi:hypothetical protein
VGRQTWCLGGRCCDGFGQRRSCRGVHYDAMANDSGHDMEEQSKRNGVGLLALVSGALLGIRVSALTLEGAGEGAGEGVSFVSVCWAPIDFHFWRLDLCLCILKINLMFGWSRTEGFPDAIPAWKAGHAPGHPPAHSGTSLIPPRGPAPVWKQVPVEGAGCSGWRRS